MKNSFTPDINEAINESWLHAPRPKRSTINKVLSFFQLAKPTCEGLFTYKTAQNGVRTIELQAAISMDIDPTDPPDPLIYTCACKHIKDRTCPSFKLVRERLAQATRGRDLCMFSSEPQIKANVIDCDSEARPVDNANSDVIISEFVNTPERRNQQLNPITIYSTPGIDNAKHSANGSNSQGNCLQHSDVLHSYTFSNSQIEKDSMP